MASIVIMANICKILTIFASVVGVILIIVSIIAWVLIPGVVYEEIRMV